MEVYVIEVRIKYTGEMAVLGVVVDEQTAHEYCRRWLEAEYLDEKVVKINEAQYVVEGGSAWNLCQGLIRAVMVDDFASMEREIEGQRKVRLWLKERQASKK